MTTTTPSSDIEVAAAAFPAGADAATAAEYRRRGWWGDEVLLDHVRRHARERPDAPAFVADAGTLSWTGYRDAAARLSGVLRSLGLPEGTRVAVLLPDSATVHVAFLAAEQAGLVVVGIGARAGDREIAHLVGRTGAVALVTEAHHRGRAAGDLAADLVAHHVMRHHVVVPRFEADPGGDILVDGQVSDAAPDTEGPRTHPDDLFLVNSTSGTTGLPKCVLHNQNRWMYFHQRAVLSGGLDTDEVVLSLVPAPFGFGLWTGHFTPTLLGAPTVVTERFDAERALDLIERHRVTTLACVSTQFVMMLNAPGLGDRDLSSLRVMFTGGEAVPYERAVDFEARTGATVLQFFGSNETGLLSGTTLDDTADHRLRTAGRVIDDMQVRLYDGDRDVTGTGRGQPAGRGPAACLGYLGDPAANEQLLTPDGWMLMGDICTLDADGYLTVVGRTSDFIIRGGKNISAPQVEDEVGTHPAVALAAAVAWPDPVFGERVCAYVELKADAADAADSKLDLDALTAHLAARGTSKELFPEVLVVLDHLPRSSGGKVAKGELRADVARRATEATQPNHPV
ncbi:MAG TPA: class I adenylate-forming enzyme family protein [Acidimicrobiales bacterium]|nr:class I adenylate-forming enzyme family protein [Acidimicrobiales bacterium]